MCRLDGGAYIGLHYIKPLCTDFRLYNIHIPICIVLRYSSQLKPFSRTIIIIIIINTVPRDRVIGYSIFFISSTMYTGHGNVGGIHNNIITDRINRR